MNPRRASPIAAAIGALIVVLALTGCGSDSPSSVNVPAKVPEAQAKASVAANVAGLIAAAGLTPTRPVKPGLSACEWVVKGPQEYAVSATAVFSVRSPDEAKQAVSHVHEFMTSHGFGGIRLILDDNSQYMTEGTKDGQNWGATYYPKGADRSFAIDGGTGCNVIPDGSDTPPDAP